MNIPKKKAALQKKSSLRMKRLDFKVKYLLAVNFKPGDILPNNRIMRWVVQLYRFFPKHCQ